MNVAACLQTVKSGDSMHPKAEEMEVRNSSLIKDEKRKTPHPEDKCKEMRNSSVNKGEELRTPPLKSKSK